VPNDCDLSPERRVLLLTGPNMAGKSTFLRQNALIAVLAQAGLPVPAEEARIGVVDRLFSRVGAADDLARGRSTFMVEMTETAAILHQAGPRSLVVVDEIGRGTATLDGLAIAWAVLEALHNPVCAAVPFSPHISMNLPKLADRMPRMAPHTMRVKEWKQAAWFSCMKSPKARRAILGRACRGTRRRAEIRRAAGSLSVERAGKADRAAGGWRSTRPAALVRGRGEPR
jgi:DNA mismatch repair protein MutS